MPNTVNFNGRQIVEPGIYSAIKGQVPSPAVTLNYGNVFLIDTGNLLGRGAGNVQPAFGGGSGIFGDLQSNGNSIYSFSNAQQFKTFVRGGKAYDLVDYLMAPSLNNFGPNKLYHARAATTTAPSFTFAFPTSAGSAKIIAKNEGIGSNGALNTATVPIISRGYGCKIKAGIINPAAFIIEFYEGQFRGLGDDGNPYDGIAENSVVQYIVASSVEFTTCAQFLAWAQTDNGFNNRFQIDTVNSVTSAVTISASVLTTYATIQLFTGGTTVYSLTALQAILDNITDYDNSIFVCDDYGVTPTLGGSDVGYGCNKGALSTFNQAILTHISTQATYTNKCMYIGGGQDSTQYTTGGLDGSKDVAAFYNSPAVVLVHSAVKVPSNVSGTGISYKFNSSLYSAALVAGRIAGVQPQVPGTYKDVRIIGVKHDLKKYERVDALQHGVLHFRNVSSLGWVINQSINTLQNNASIIYNDGTSPEISVMRIIYQMNAELVASGQRFIGGNLNSVTGGDLINFTNSYLQDRTSTTTDDNLILAGPHKVTATYSNGAWRVTYCFIVNAPVNQIFFTGFLLDPSVSVGNI